MTSSMNIYQSGNNSIAIGTDPAAVAAAETAKAKIQAAYIMALQKPRNYDNARLKILAACKRPDFAEKVEYVKPVGNGSISGPSIRFAELAMREWTNITSTNQVVFDDESVRRISVTITDMETNTTFSKEIQLSKTVERKSKRGREQDVVGERLNSRGDTVYILKATEDEVQTREAALISKALRNEGLRLIPQEIIEEGIKVARETMQSRDKKDPDAARKKLTEAFFSYGVMPSNLEEYLGHTLAQCQPDEFQKLRSIYLSIRDGEATWSSFVEKKDEERKAKDGSVMDQIMNASAPAESTKARKVQKAESPQPPIEAPVTLVEAETIPTFPPFPPAEHQTPRVGLTPLEALREEALTLMGPEPDGLGLRPDEQERYMTRTTGKGNLKELTIPDLKAVINEARSELDRRDAEGR